MYRQVTIREQACNLLVSFPYDAKLVEILRTMPSRSWDPKTKEWIVPKSHREILKSKLGLEKSVSADPSPAARPPTLATGRSVKLFPYQELCVKWAVKNLHEYKGCLIADPTGVGKTLEALGIIAEVKPSRCLVVCNKTLLYNWEREVRRFFPNARYVVIDGTAGGRERLWRDSNQDIFIVNYDLLFRDRMPTEWGMIIADEVTSIKNPSAQRSRALKRLKTKMRIGLTGTPIENNLLEFHSIMEWVQPGLFASRQKFMDAFCIMNQWGQPVAYKNLSVVRYAMQPYVIRRRKEDVLKELPPKFSRQHPIKLSQEERRIYRRIATAFVDWLRSQNEPAWQANALTRLLRLRQCLDHPALVNERVGAISKLEALQDLVEEADKVVIFSQWVQMVNILASVFKDSRVITGDTKAQDRIKIIERFNEDDTKVLICSDAVNMGVNITGAETIIHYDALWNPAKMLQREDRLYRYGQKKNVQAIELMVLDSIEERVHELLREKRQLANMVLEEGDAIRKLSKQDLAWLALGDEARDKRREAPVEHTPTPQHIDSRAAQAFPTRVSPTPQHAPKRPAPAFPARPGPAPEPMESWWAKLLRFLSETRP